MPDKTRLLDDLYRFCRKLKLKEHFHDPARSNSVPVDEESDERCELNAKVSNRFYNPSQDPSKVLATYISAMKKDVSDMMNKPNYENPNMTVEEREALKSLKEREDVIIQSADKGGKVVVMNRSEYTEKCNLDLSNGKFYKVMQSDPTPRYVEEIHQSIADLRSQEIITENEAKFLSEHLDDPTVPSFYGLPKIHKSFTNFPPLRPIVSNINSCTRRISEFLDSFLKYQARRCASFVRDTKHFLQKLEELKKSPLPKNSILVTMDVASLYTNIDHEEGAEACFAKLEQRKNKKVPSRTLKSMILLVLKCTAFKFGSTIYEQIKGTCMGTPMAPNYANLFMDKFENDLIREYTSKTGHRPLVWFRYIDDVFFVWTHGSESLNDFIQFCQSFSKEKKMKSSIKFETNISPDEVDFLDVKVRLKDGCITTTLYTKPTDAFLYLNTSSNHPKHVKTNIPKGQFIRVRRICSQNEDFLSNCATLSSYFEKRGYKSEDLKKSIKEVSMMPRSKLLEDTEKIKRDPQLIFVCDWHPNVARLPSALKKHFHLLQNDTAANEIFTSVPMVAYRRPRSLKNILVRNRIREVETPKITEPCRKKNCKLCKDIISTDKICNTKRGISIKTEGGGTCQTKNAIYGVICTRCDMICVGQTGVALSSRFSKHRYDIKNRPDNSEIAEHFHTGHQDGDMKVFLLQTGLSTSEEQREYHEDRWMCRLQSLQATNSSGMNKKTKFYAKEMYASYNKMYGNP